MITLWGRQSSSNVQAVLWCILELDLPYERIDAGLTYGVTDTAEYLAINPNGTVPTICDGDQPAIWESAAILRYLSCAYAEESFWPSSPVEGSQIDMWAEWSKINVALQFTSPIFWPAVRVHESRRDALSIDNAVKALEVNLKIADERLSQSSYLASDHLTMADIQFAHVLYRYFEIDIKRADLAHLQRYYDSLCKRPAYRSAVMVSYEELVNTL